jgi:hypothetical protein
MKVVLRSLTPMAKHITPGKAGPVKISDDIID